MRKFHGKTPDHQRHNDMSERVIICDRCNMPLIFERKQKTKKCIACGHKISGNRPNADGFVIVKCTYSQKKVIKNLVKGVHTCSYQDDCERFANCLFLMTEDKRREEKLRRLAEYKEAAKINLAAETSIYPALEG